ncbi:hypothetical protein ACFQS1_38290 [Paractinoplanes rhizophilus]|uniref:Uncharacterized protein n=1 Tax=Paractinoplanes rhizophilus TaxID=1416877 RepID=A0ABW2I4M4_9ACTN
MTPALARRPGEPHAESDAWRDGSFVVVGRNERLGGIAFIALGFAVAGFGGITLVDQRLKQWLRQRWTAITTDPEPHQADDAE